MSKDDYLDISDLESIKRALENAEIDYEVDTDLNGMPEGSIVITTENGIEFTFSENGKMNGLDS